jgi:hypothetical protein
MFELGRVDKGDDATLSIERGAIDAAPTPPEEVVAAARRAFLAWSGDARRADVVFDSLLDGNHLARGIPRVLMFSGSGFAAVLTVTRAGHACSVAGVLSAPGHALALSIRLAIGEQQLLVCKDDGRLEPTVVPAGTVSFVARSKLDGRAWHCDWIRL